MTRETKAERNHRTERLKGDSRTDTELQRCRMSPRRLSIVLMVHECEGSTQGLGVDASKGLGRTMAGTHTKLKMGPVLPGQTGKILNSQGIV